MTNLEKYSEVFCKTFEITADKLAGLKYQDIDAWDSVGHMTLVANLEDAFDIMLSAFVNCILDYVNWRVVHKVFSQCYAKRLYVVNALENVIAQTYILHT